MTQIYSQPWAVDMCSADEEIPCLYEIVRFIVTFEQTDIPPYYDAASDNPQSQAFGSNIIRTSKPKFPICQLKFCINFPSPHRHPRPRPRSRPSVTPCVIFTNSFIVQWCCIKLCLNVQDGGPPLDIHPHRLTQEIYNCIYDVSVSTPSTRHAVVTNTPPHQHGEAIWNAI